MERALREGRDAIVAGKTAKAIEILRKADPSHKDRRTAELLAVAHSKRGFARYKAGKIDLARQDFAAADRLTPGDERILQSLGVVCLELRRTDEAERYMSRVLKIDSENSVALGVLARIAASREDNAKASEMYKKASRAAPERRDYSRMAEKLSKESKVEAGFVVQARGKFEVKFERGKTAGVERAVQTVLGYLDQASRDIEALLGAKPARRISVVVYNGEQFERVRSAHSWARAYYDGKLRVAVRGWPAGRTELRRDLRHELTHAFIHELHPKAPLWLHEGLASYAAIGKSTAAAQQFRSGKYELLDLSTFTGAFANSGDPTVVRRGYLQSLMLVGYLKRTGSTRQLQALLREIDGGTDADVALRLVYRRGMKDLLQAALR